jgi:transposase
MMEDVITRTALTVTALGAQQAYEIEQLALPTTVPSTGRAAQVQWLQEIAELYPGGHTTMTSSNKEAEMSTAYYRGVPVRVIASTLHVSSKTIAAVTQGRAYQGHPGRPLKATAEIRSFIETNWLADARISDDQMRIRVESRYGASLKRQTVCRLRKELGFKWRPPMHVQVVDDQQRCSRVWGFQEYQRRRDPRLVNGDPRKIGIVVFSDESRFCRGNDNRWVRVRRGEWNDTATVGKVKYPTGVMVWAAIGPNNFRLIERCDLKIDGPEYLPLIQRSRLAELADQKYGAGNWYFMQDGAPSHTARKTVEELQKRMRVLEGWPPESPDANPIEMVWSIIGSKIASFDWAETDRLGQKAVRDKLWELVETTFKELSEETINSLCSQFDDRMSLIVQCNGKSVSQLLSSHMSAPRGEKDIAPAVPAGYTDEDDAFLLQAVTRAKKSIPYSKIAADGRWAGREALRDKRLLKWRVTYLRMTAANQEFVPPGDPTAPLAPLAPAPDNEADGPMPGPQGPPAPPLAEILAAPVPVEMPIAKPDELLIDGQVLPDDGELHLPAPIDVMEAADPNVLAVYQPEIRDLRPMGPIGDGVEIGVLRPELFDGDGRGRQQGVRRVMMFNWRIDGPLTAAAEERGAAEIPTAGEGC